MHILFADKFPLKQLEMLQTAGHNTDYRPELQAADLPRFVPGKDALIVRSTNISRMTIEAANQLKIIVRAGAGTNTIDKAAASDNGILVCNVPGKNAAAVAELAFGLLLSIDRRIPDNVSEIRKGVWNKKRFSAAQGVMGKTLGIVGAGSIGMCVAERAQAFGMKILMVKKASRSENILKKMEQLGVEEVKDLKELAMNSDVITVHVPSVPATRNLISEEFLSWMKSDSILLNTSRGEIIDEEALLGALSSKPMRAGLDVYVNEPAAPTGEFRSKLAQHPNVYGTHHIGASTFQAQNAVANGVVEILKAYEKGKVLNRVN